MSDSLLMELGSSPAPCLIVIALERGADVIGGIAETHFTVMGSTDPAGMTVTADQIAGQLRQERIDSILLSPV